MMPPEINVGDWIAFYHGGKLVIDEVRYVTGAGTMVDPRTANTASGAARVEWVLEVRKKGA